MKRRCTPSFSARAVSAGLILTLVSCSGPQSHQHGFSAAETRHPNLSLYPGKVSHNLLISDAELKAGKIERGRAEHVSAVKVLKGAVIFTGSLPFMIGAARAGICWAPDLPDVYVDDKPKRHVLPYARGVQVKLTGMEIRYLPAKAGGGMELARVVGQARIDVTDAFGSYYCRADELHYRAATSEIILRGRVSVSSTYAPDIHDFGLTRIDLARCALEYTSKGQKQPSLSKQDSESLVAVHTRAAYR